MQWLIDLIIETIGVPPCYIDRGDPVDYDFDEDDLIQDAAWHELDLSSIVPAGATAILFSVYLLGSANWHYFELRKFGNVNTATSNWLMTLIAGLGNASDLICACDENRKIDYKFSAGGAWTFALTVKGWWL